jgi:hypothetical protein
MNADLTWNHRQAVDSQIQKGEMKEQITGNRRGSRINGNVVIEARTLIFKLLRAPFIDSL